MQAGDGRYRHAELHGRIDQGKLLIGTVAPPALASGDDFHAGRVIGHRRIPRRKPRSSRLR